ncbi:MAG: hypothetical protein JO182_13885 [Acidobacteriaceae bacterium]|nr:hypothetical protein [Acidobacteriaceae bacterium]MBV9035574.1 hypothetical protein [Acidobacteriaceae bacterium]MBV9304641.1 hypothetical protein [Acidobacteriaceae bacterium]MBV9678567.1 hypothetical protein [Acidobacteriaceae bacterium]MBV9939502.1 hypothetical protein [Acidobacteriaceae bacterium]
MTKFASPLHKQAEYSSVAWRNSNTYKGVRYAVRKMSLAQRIEMAERIQQLSSKYEFLKTGDALEKAEAHLADLLVRKLYLEWGLAIVEGLAIDGEKASVELLIEKGPELLCDEIIASIRAELELSEEERKNS